MINLLLRMAASTALAVSVFMSIHPDAGLFNRLGASFCLWVGANIVLYTAVPE